MRRWISIAPASRSIRTSWRVVWPRTIESSTTTMRLPHVEPARADREHLAGRDLTQQLCADHVERAALGGDAVALAELAERERPQAERIAEGDDRVARERDDREGPLQARQHIDDRVL